MELEKNVGLIDRIFRAIFGTAFVLGGIVYLAGIALFTSVFVGTVLIITAFTAACPAYSVLGISTCGHPCCDVRRKEPEKESAYTPLAEQEPIEFEEAAPAAAQPVKKAKPKKKAKKKKAKRKKKKR